MKYMIEWKVRSAGLTHDQNLSNQDALLKAFGKWTPEAGLTVHGKPYVAPPAGEAKPAKAPGVAKAKQGTQDTKKTRASAPRT